MKIAYFISSWGHGRGGHFYSLRTIRDAMPVDSLVVNIGSLASPVFEGLSNVRFFDVSSCYISRIREASRHLKEESVTHLHSFDVDSYYFASILSALCGLPVIHTKPGGPAPRRYYPFVNYLSVFSGEDYEYFGQRHFSGLRKLELIPNRLSSFIYDEAMISKIRQMAAGRKVLLRIARISHFHKKSIFQTLALASELQAKGIRIIPIIIGAIQDPDVHRVLVLEVEKVGGLLLTEDVYTINAKRLLPCADYVVGTGRSFMEAAFARAVLLSPTENGSFPILVDEHNYDDFKFSNFSGRGISVVDNGVIQSISSMVSDSSCREGYLRFVDRICAEDFEVGGGREQYLNLYKCASRQIRIVTLGANLLFRFLSRFVTRVSDREKRI